MHTHSLCTHHTCTFTHTSTSFSHKPQRQPVPPAPQILSTVHPWVHKNPPFTHLILSDTYKLYVLAPQCPAPFNHCTRISPFNLQNNAIWWILLSSHPFLYTGERGGTNGESFAWGHTSSGWQRCDSYLGRLVMPPLHRDSQTDMEEGTAPHFHHAYKITTSYPACSHIHRNPETALVANAQGHTGCSTRWNILLCLHCLRRVSSR